MHRDYRLATYALGISAVLLVASGAAVIVGASLSPGPTDEPTNETHGTQRDADHHQRFNETLTQSGDSTYTLQQAERTCGGALRLDSAERHRTSRQVGNVTVTLVSHHDRAESDKIGR